LPGGYKYTKTWRYRYPQKRNLERRRYYARLAQGCPNAREPWSKQDIEAILAPNRPSDRELARSLGRSVQAVHVRRSTILHMGKGCPLDVCLESTVAVSMPYGSNGPTK
jgi:hypothetical protein